ncbi:extracellular solute-binding protein [Occultella glacieicola]|uniref:Extracellular solute-binding protein n=1 Tax=Occultella glacieicola TaxID=2518684 RepID=A0ABY2DYV8_9MICO|nr:extracellular solute-binding protein [Occultella glacieicola]
MQHPSFDRRTFLLGAGGALTLAALPSCSTGGTGSEAPTTDNSGVELPSYIPSTGVKPDLQGTPEGVPDGFFNYPADQHRSVTETPGAGESISGMAMISTAVPPTRSENAYWRELEDRLGVSLDLMMTPSADYDQKLATVVAGGDIPDMVQIRDAPDLPRLLESQFQDLSEYLSGDAIQDYPNLATLPPLTWRGAIYNGGIYGIPNPRQAIGSYVFVRQDIFDSLGLSTEPENLDEFLETCRALTNAQENRWAMGDSGSAAALVIMGMLSGVPNEWRNENGSLTHKYETDEFARSVEWVTQLWQDGLMHPDTFASSDTSGQWFHAGRTGIWLTGNGHWNSALKNHPTSELGLMTLPNWDGGGLAPWRLGSGFFSINAFKKAEPERIKLLLRVCNWLAAPFGSEENYLRAYGLDGVHHTVDADGNPTLTELGQAELRLPVSYLAAPPTPLYTPGRPDDTRVQHAYQSEVIPVGEPNPVIGLYSATDADDGVRLKQTFDDAVNDIITGRATISTLTESVDAWKRDGGDAMRAEYEEQLAAYPID